MRTIKYQSMGQALQAGFKPLAEAVISRGRFSFLISGTILDEYVTVEIPRDSLIPNPTREDE